MINFVRHTLWVLPLLSALKIYSRWTGYMLRVLIFQTGKCELGPFQQRKGNVHLRLWFILGTFLKTAASLGKCLFDLQCHSTSPLLSPFRGLFSLAA